MSVECEEGCRKCGAKTHTSRNCREDLPNLTSINQFPELTKETPKENSNKRMNEITTEKDEKQQRDSTMDGQTTNDDLSTTSEVRSTGDLAPTGADMEETEEINIEDILQEVAAAFPACGEQTMDGAVCHEREPTTETETPISESEGNTVIETANKRKRKGKKHNTTRVRTTKAANKKTKADNTGSSRTKKSATSDPSAIASLKR